MTENILLQLEESGRLFKNYVFSRENGSPLLLGKGGFSSIYEMQNRNNPDKKYALKVIGLESKDVEPKYFKESCGIQKDLQQQSEHIVRIIDCKMLTVSLDDDNRITAIHSVNDKETDENELTLKFALMEKLEPVIETDRFHNAELPREELKEDKEILKLLSDIGMALITVHENKCIHRDVKLENIFWDRSEEVYKLGDFGISKRTIDGNAETIEYTDGYGAPEIEKLNETYGSTVDIYSLGIVLYLLYNDLKFPGSSGYYPNNSFQYDVTSVFPAPKNASERMTAIIRKMCSFYPEDRYKSVKEVLEDIIKNGMYDNSASEEEISEFLDMITETYHSEDTARRQTPVEDIITETYHDREIVSIESLLDDEESDDFEEEDRPVTRADRIRWRKGGKDFFGEVSVSYYLAMVPLLVLLFKCMNLHYPDTLNLMMWVLPAGLFLLAVSQKIGELNLTFGIALSAFAIYSAYISGCSMLHIMVIVCVILGIPALSAAGATAMALWLFLESGGFLSFLDFAENWELGWIVMIAIIPITFELLMYRVLFADSMRGRFQVNILLFDKIPILITLAGVIILILDKAVGLDIPEILSKMHLIYAGIGSFVICLVLKIKVWGFLADEERVD
ncbi:MAG: protein kinase [Lachnospiraceae bacterium]|nr:protein kinase [Lachnospiraceae bacterium]